MPSRRDVLRILILSSGALYMSTPLGSCKSGKRTSLKKSDSPSSHIARQSFEAPHRYLRAHRSDSLHWNNASVYNTEIIIVGAGPSGLSAAVALDNSGRDFILLDNEPFAGGAARTGTYRNINYPLASIYFVERSAAVDTLINYAGVEPVKVRNDAIMLDQTIYYDLWSDKGIDTLPIKREERWQLRRFRDDLLDLREHGNLPAYPLPETLSHTLLKYDQISAEEYIARYRSPLLRMILDTYSRSSMGGTLEQVNAYALLNFYASEIDSPRYTFSGGLGGLTRSIIEKLGNRIKTAMTCVHIQQNPNQISVWATDEAGQLHRFDGQLAIVAVQKFMLPMIINDLPDKQRTAMQSLVYSPFLTVHLCSEKQLLPPAFDIWMPAGGRLYTDIINTAATYPEQIQASIASVYAPRSPSERSILQSTEILASFARKVAEDVALRLPTIEPSWIDEVHIFGWGHALVVPTPGSHGGIAQHARYRHGRLLFANTDNDATPAFENAVEHGLRAAEQAIALLSSA